MTFTKVYYNNSFSFCSSTSLPIVSIPITLHLSGSDFASYTFSPSSTIMLNVVNNVTNSTPSVSLVLNNQQKTFLDINFTNNIDGIIFYDMMIGSNQSSKTLQSMQVYIKSGTWLLSSPADFMSRIYTADRDEKIQQFFQAASTRTIRISNLLPESPYTLCAYIINLFGVAGSTTCVNLYTMSWGTILKAKLTFSSALTYQQLNNVVCFFTAISGTNQLYLVDGEGNSCGNRSVTNIYYKYKGSSFVTETQGTNIYLITNPTITGSDPSPLAFTNLFGATGSLSTAAVTAAQSMFSITYLSATYVSSVNARLMTATSQPAALNAYFATPSYNATNSILTLSNVQLVGGQGSIYFVLVLYKQIASNNTLKATTVNIKMNQMPTTEQVLNCENWLGMAADGCARAVYTGVAPLTVVFA